MADMTRLEPALTSDAKHGGICSAFLEAIAAPVLVLDRQARIVGCNRSWETASGYAGADVRNRRLTDLLDAGSVKPFSHMFQQLSEGQPGQLEYIWKTKTGQIRMMSASFSALQGDDGKVEYVIGVGADLSELRRATEELERQLSLEQHTRAEAEASIRRLNLLNEAQQRLSASLDYATTLSTLAHLAVPALADWCAVDLIDTDGALRRQAVAHRHAEGEKLLWHLEHRYPLTPDTGYGSTGVLRNGEPVLLATVTEAALVNAARSSDHLHLLRELGLQSVMCVPIVLHDRPIGALLLVSAEAGRRFTSTDLALATDLAHCAASAIDNARQYQDALRAIQQREAHLKAVSHELKNPLHTILFLTAYQPREGAPDQSHYLAQPPMVIIQRAARQMRRLIADILDLDAIDVGHLPLQLEQVDLNLLVTETLDTLQPLTLEKGIQLRRNLGQDVGAVTCDRERIHQVLSNLIGNAVRFTPRGGTIQVRTAVNGGEVQLTVSDTGRGLSEAQLPYVFDRHWQALPRERHGQGLGLAISKGIVEAHGGRMWVESRPGRGATFHCTLPVVGSAPD